MYSFRRSTVVLLVIQLFAIVVGRDIFEKACTANPVYLYGGDQQTNWEADRSKFVLSVDSGSSDGIEVTIHDVGSRTVGQHAPIKAALLQAVDESGQVVGDWNPLQGSFYEVQCPRSSQYASSVAVADSIPSNEAIRATWHPPTHAINSVTIRGFVVDNANRLHRTPPHTLTGSYQWPQKNFPSLDECGSTKGCYLVPPNCALPNCIYAMTWRSVGDSVVFQLMTVADGWVGVGFSRDNSLRDNEYAVCVRQPDDSVELFTTRVDSNIAKIGPISADYARYYPKKRGIYSDKRLFCSFTRFKSPSEVYGSSRVTNLADPHYIIATYGNRGDIIGDSINLMKNGNVPIISSSRVDFNKEAHYPFHSAFTGSWLAKVHMCLMIIAWVLLASIAILTSRYYRPVWSSDWRRNGKRSWLSVHQPLIISVAVLTVIAFIFILFEVNWTWINYGRQFWHSFLGIIVVILAVINAALVFCVPKRQGRAYCIWFWVHWFVSSLAHCLAIPVIFLGMDLPRLDLWNWCSWLLLAWCIFHMITDLILEIHYCMAYRRSYERFEEVDSKGRGLDRASQRYPPGYQWKPFCLGFYIVVTLSVVLTLVIAIIVYD